MTVFTVLSSSWRAEFLKFINSFDLAEVVKIGQDLTECSQMYINDIKCVLLNFISYDDAVDFATIAYRIYS